jgi:hypothetical protein
LSADEEKALRDYSLLGLKPQLLTLNVGEEDGSRMGALEDDGSRMGALEDEFGRRYAGPGVRVAALCGQVEMELAELSEEEEQEFRQSMGVLESGVQRVLARTFDLLGLITFYTVVGDECRAWTIPGTPAVKAAGKIHRYGHGFIGRKSSAGKRCCARARWPRPGTASAQRQGLRRAGRRRAPHPVQRVSCVVAVDSARRMDPSIQRGDPASSGQPRFQARSGVPHARYFPRVLLPCKALTIILGGIHSPGVLKEATSSYHQPAGVMNCVDSETAGC